MGDRKADYVDMIIDLKEQKKKIEEQIKATEIMILQDKELQKDERIVVVKGKPKFTLTDDAYERLEDIGEEITVTETRRKTLEEFDPSIQEVLLGNEENYNKKVSKDYIRIKKGAK